MSNPSKTATLALYPHSAYPPAFTMQLKASVINLDNALVFLFQCRYPVDEHSIKIALPTPSVPTACDNLWQHTCCEAFVSTPDSDAYLEFNFSPSGCWAAYRFDEYRVRDEVYVCPFAPTIDFTQNIDGFELTATISSEVLPVAQSWLVGLTAVIETTDGHKNYWALRHDAPQADFHLRSQFLHTLYL